MRRSIALIIPACLVLVGPSGAPASTFTPGDVYWAAGGSMLEVSGGGDLSSTPVFASTGFDGQGQIAWSADLSTAYVTNFEYDTIDAVSSTGGVASFATGVEKPTGILRTTDGRLLASTRDEGIFDVTSGGSFTGASPFATGLGITRNLLQLDDGRILAATSAGVFDVTGGGSFGTATPFAVSDAGLRDLVQDASGRLYASEDGSPSGRSILDITGGGDFSTTTPFATGQHFSALTVTSDGRLLAGANGTTSLFDVTAGGDFSSATPWATNLPTNSFLTLDTVPVPEPSTALLFGLGLAGFAARGGGLGCGAARPRSRGAPGTRACLMK